MRRWSVGPRDSGESSCSQAPSSLGLCLLRAWERKSQGEG